MNVAVLRTSSAGDVQPEFDIGATADAEISSSATVPEEPAASSSSNTGSTSKRAYPPPAEVPTQTGSKGLQFDFNDGCRVVLPESEHPWRVRISAISTPANPVRDRDQGRARQQHQALLRALPRSKSGRTARACFGHDYCAPSARC